MSLISCKIEAISYPWLSRVQRNLECYASYISLASQTFARKTENG